MSSLVDSVWTAMRDDELYSPRDLADTLGLPEDATVRVLELLARYGFAERVTKRELIFRKLADAPDPGGTLRILEFLIADSDRREPKRLPSLQQLRKATYDPRRAHARARSRHTSPTRHEPMARPNQTGR